MVYETTKPRKRCASASQPDETTTKRSRPTTDAEDFSEADNEVEVATTEADDEPEMGGYGDGMCILFNTTKLFNLFQSTTMWLLHLRSIRISQLRLPSPNVSFYSRYYIFFN